LANSSPTTFERRFAKISRRLGLGNCLDSDELNLLYEAAFYATLCNIAFNGHGGCGGEIKADREFTRRRLEQDFMVVRERFFRSPGWTTLSKEIRGSVQRVFLDVFILEENLAE
jgi:hypothetical protein